ncbi:MAG TPA: hypothetical protein VGF59_10115, partial [Bryobacteraceae bacterium]
DSLFFGVLLSYWHRFHPEKFRAAVNRVRPYLLPISLLFILPAFVLDQDRFFTYTVGLTCLYLGYGGLMVFLLQIPLTTEGFWGRVLIPFSYIGQHSYPIYLFHLMVLQQLLERGLLEGTRGLVLYFMSSIAVGIVFSKIIEFPILKLRDRIFPLEVAPQTTYAAANRAA